MEAERPLLATTGVVITIVPGIGLHAGRNWLLCIGMDFCVRDTQKSWQKVSFRQVKAFPACLEGIASTEELVLNFKKEKRWDKQNALSVFKNDF